MDNLDQFGPLWTPLNSHGPICITIEPTWTQNDPFGLKITHLYPLGHIETTLDPSGPIWMFSQGKQILALQNSSWQELSKNIMHLGVGDIKPPPSVRPPPTHPYEGLGGQGVRGVGGLPKDSTIRIQFEGLSKII